MSLAASPNCENEAPSTLKDIIGRYSKKRLALRELSPLTERRENSAQINNEANSLATTQKDLRGANRNIVGRDVIVSESLRSSLHREERSHNQKGRIIEHLEKELANYKCLLHVVNEQKISLVQKCHLMEEEIQISHQLVREMQGKALRLEVEKDALQKSLRMAELSHMQQMKMLEMRLNSLDSNRQVGVQSMKEKEQVIEQLNRRLLSQQQDYAKLTKVNKLLRQQLKAKQIKFVDEQQPLPLRKKTQPESDDKEKQIQQLQQFYERQMGQLKNQLTQTCDAYRKSEQCSKLQLQKLRKERNQCQKQLNHIRQEAVRLEEMYSSIMTKKDVEQGQELSTKLKEMSQQKHQQYERMLRQLMLRLSKQPSSNKRVSQLFDKEIDKLKRGQSTRQSRIVQLQGELGNLKAKLSNFNMSYDMLTAELKELRQENHSSSLQLIQTKTKLQDAIGAQRSEQQRNDSLKQQLAEAQAELIRSVASNKENTRLIESLSEKIRSHDRHNAQLQKRYKDSNGKLQELAVQLKLQQDKLHAQISQMEAENSSLKHQNKQLVHQLETIPQLIEQQYRQKVSNLEQESAQATQSKQQTLSEKQVLHCRLKSIERQYEKLRSEMVDMQALLKIAGKVQKRYSKQNM